LALKCHVFVPFTCVGNDMRRNKRKKKQKEEREREKERERE
jgi:hypothetical protein